MTTGQKYDAEYDVADDLTDLGPMLFRQTPCTERKILDMDKKYEHRSEDNKQEHVNGNQGETVITGFHKETTESEVVHLLREMINEIGMDFGSARIECPAKPITHAFIHFANDGE